MAEEIFRGRHRHNRRYDPGRGVAAGTCGRESLRRRRNLVGIETYDPAREPAKPKLDDLTGGNGRGKPSPPEDGVAVATRTNGEAQTSH